MARTVGIDLGTTNSVVSVYRRGMAETIRVDGQTTTPSVVSFPNDKPALIGQAAKNRMLLAPEETVASAKRFMGDPAKRYQIGKQSFSPVDIGKMILGKLVEAASRTLGEKINEAVITVPAYFNEDQRKDTKIAAVNAGLTVLRLVPEPTAAAIAYGLDQGKNQKLLVYDLGGGTFDVSILSVIDNNFDVIAVGGAMLGGDDFDAAIMAWANANFLEKTGVDVKAASPREAQAASQRLKEAAERVKIALSKHDVATLAVPDYLGHPLELELSLAKYNELISPFLERTIACVHKTLKDAKTKAIDIDRVILVGGSTWNRAVRELVAREIKEPFIAERVDEIVAHGAAIVADRWYLPVADDRPVRFQDVTGHSLGVVMGDDGKDISMPVIPRQTRYPCRMGIFGFTRQPNQDAVLVSVYRGEDPDPSNNIALGELVLPVTPPSVFIVPVAAIFELDADGIIRLTAVQLPPLDPAHATPNYGTGQGQQLDLALVDKLIQTGKVQTKSVEIRVQ